MEPGTLHTSPTGLQSTPDLLPLRPTGPIGCLPCVGAVGPGNCCFLPSCPALPLPEIDCALPFQKGCHCFFSQDYNIS
jgi:hypothetical protein